MLDNCKENVSKWCLKKLKTANRTKPFGFYGNSPMEIRLGRSNIACVAGARKGKGEGKIGRARNARREGEGKRKLSPSRRAFLVRPIFPSPFPFLAPATQANQIEWSLTRDYQLIQRQ